MALAIFPTRTQARKAMDHHHQRSTNQPKGQPMTTTDTTTLAQHLGIGSVGPVSVRVAQGVPAFGAPAARRPVELRDRVRAAIVNSGLAWPLASITVEVRGECPDLAVALALLVASAQITKDHANTAWAAAAPSVSLDGSLRPCRFRDLVELLATTRPL